MSSYPTQASGHYAQDGRQFTGSASASTPPPPPPKPSDSVNDRRMYAQGPPLPPTPDQRGTTSNAQYNNGSYYQQAHVIQQPIPAVPPGWLPDLLHDKTTQDIHELLQDPDLQAAILRNPQTSHPSIGLSKMPLEQLLEANSGLAQSLQQLESRLVDQRSSVQSRLLALRALEQQHRSKIAETEDNLRNFSPMALYQRLNGSVQEQDALVKGIEESFLEQTGIASEREIADFMRRVRDAKRTAFLRTERKERWDEGRVGGWR